MKSTGMVRKIDELGRIVLPIEMRRTLGIDKRDPLEMFVDQDSIILKKYEPACMFCGKGTDTVSFQGKMVCRECIKALIKA